MVHSSVGLSWTIVCTLSWHSSAPCVQHRALFKGTVSRDGSSYFSWHAWIDLGLNKCRGWFSNFKMLLCWPIAIAIFCAVKVKANWRNYTYSSFFDEFFRGSNLPGLLGEGGHWRALCKVTSLFAFLPPWCRSQQGRRPPWAPWSRRSLACTLWPPCRLSYLLDTAAGRGADLPGLLGAGGHRRVLLWPPCLISYLFDATAGRGADLPGLLGAGGHQRVLCDLPVGFPTSLMPQPAGAQTSLGSLEKAVTGMYFVSPLFAFLPPWCRSRQGHRPPWAPLEQAVTGVYFVTPLFAFLPPWYRSRQARRPPWAPWSRRSQACTSLLPSSPPCTRS